MQSSLLNDDSYPRHQDKIAKGERERERDTHSRYDKNQIILRESHSSTSNLFLPGSLKEIVQTQAKKIQIYTWGVVFHTHTIRKVNHSGLPSLVFVEAVLAAVLVVVI